MIQLWFLLTVYCPVNTWNSLVLMESLQFFHCRTSILDRHAETLDCWTVEFQIDSNCSYFDHTKKSSANIHALSANMTKIVCKCRILLEFQTPAFRGFCKPEFRFSAVLTSQNYAFKIIQLIPMPFYLLSLKNFHK